MPFAEQGVQGDVQSLPVLPDAPEPSLDDTVAVQLALGVSISDGVLIGDTATFPEGRVGIEQRINELLRSSTSVTSLVGTRIRPLTLAQEEANGVTFQRLGWERYETMGGSAEPITARFELSAWSTSITEAKDIAAGIKGAVNWWTGRGSTAYPEVLRAVLEQQTNNYDGQYHEISQTYLIHHTT